MAKNVFDSSVNTELLLRINTLSSSMLPKWGKMSVSQMLAHCCVPYEFVYESIHPKPKGLKKFLIRLFIKKIVTNEKAYSKNGRTSKEFIITDQVDFEKEKSRLIDYISKTSELGSNHFEGKESHSFGKLTSTEWSNMFYKHLDHHLTQFGV